MEQLEFDCPYCGQRFTATQDLLGTDIGCPHCGGAVALPPPQPPAPPPLPSKLDALIAKVAELGLTYKPSPGSKEMAELEDDEIAAAAAFQKSEEEWLEEFLHEFESLGQTLKEMGWMEEITAYPSEAELQTIIGKIFEKIRKGDWGSTEDEVKRIIFKASPHIRAKKKR